MRKSKKILSILLAMIMLCSTFAIGAQAAYSNYKDSNISEYDAIDQPKFSAAQLASVALDEVDRMLLEMDETSIKVPIINVTIDYSSVDSALDSLEDVYNGSAWATVTSIAGDLGNLNFSALNTDAGSKNFAANGCRRTTAGKTDLDVLYSLINFLYDNRALLASYGYGTLDIGATLSGLLGDNISDYLNAPKLLKGLAYEAVYKEDAPETITVTIDQMLQKLVDDQLDDLEVWAAKSAGYGLSFEFSNVVNINSGSFYDNIESALQLAYNQVLVPLANTKIKAWVMEKAGAKLTDAQRIRETVVDKNGNTVTDPSTGLPMIQTVGYYLDDTAAIAAIRNSNYIYDASAQSVFAANADKFNVIADVIKLDYTIPTHDFSGSLVVTELNNLLGDWVNALLTAKNPNLTWTRGNNDNIIPNFTAIVKQLLKQYGERYLSEYITIPTDAEIDALTFETAFVRFGKELVEKFEVYSILPSNCNSVRSILSYALLELIADKVPTEDIYAQLQAGTINANSDDGWKAILAVFARYYANAYTNMNMPAGLTFDETIEHAVDWALENYGGILYFTSQINPNQTAWEKIDDAIFDLIPLNWLPSSVRVLKNGVETSVNVTGSQVLILDFLIGNILDLKFNYLLDILQRNSSSELQQTATAVVLGRVRAILNALIPGTVTTQYTTFESILTNQSLGDLITGLVSGINTVKTSLITSALPLVCQILELTTEQQLDDPLIVYPDTIISASRTLNSTSITIRNNSTGVNTGYTDANGTFHQDALYKVKIKSITTNTSGVNVAYTANEELNGGVTKTYPVTGSLSADGLVRFCVSYEILDETGASLTSSPITNYFFTYVSTTHADDDPDYYGVDDEGFPLRYVDADNIGLNTHYIVSAPEAYISSWGALKNQSYDIGRQLTSDAYMNTPATVTYNTFSSNMVAGILAGEFTALNTTYNGYYGSRDLFKVTVPQVTDPNDATLTVDDDFTDYVGNYVANLTLDFSKTGDNEQPATYTITRNLHLFNDFGLPKLVSDALSSNRQVANYATSGSFSYTETDAEGSVSNHTANASTAWSNYLTALTAAENILLKPKTASTFDATVYEAAAANLKRAIADLDACVLSAGVASLEALREGIEPSNEIPGETNPDGTQAYLAYDAAGYNFFGSEDYVLYTYERYREHRNNMNSLINSQYVIAPAADATAEEIAAYQKALDNIPTLALFDITYRGHMYQMNADRLIRTTASKNYLLHAYRTVSNAADTLDSAEYTPESWSILQRALTFSAGVISDNSSALRQSKVNTARQELIYAYKHLELKGSDPADYTQLDAAIAAADAIYAIDGYEALYTGLEDLAIAYETASTVARDLLIDSQAIVDAAAQALNDAINALVEVEAGIDILDTTDIYSGVGAEWTPTVADFEDGYSGAFICGFLLDYYDGIETIIGTTGGATYEYTPNEANSSGALATGDSITMDNGDVYYLVIYGDSNGDSFIDGSDLTEAIFMYNWESEFSERGGLYSTAADVYHDGDIDGNDFATIVFCMNYEIDPYTLPQDGSYCG